MVPNLVLINNQMSLTPFSIKPCILFEDDVILVIDKPAGLMVEPDRNNFPNLLHEIKKYLKESDPKKEIYAQHIHRLDRPVSGIVLFVKDRSVLKNLSEQFAERKVKKYYQAITEQAPKIMSGVIEHWHRKEKKRAMLSLTEIPFSEKAILKYAVLSYGKFYQWNIELHTGKFHQIRAQLASVDCPIIGDQLYGSTLPYQENAIALHASELIFHHPVSGSEMKIQSKKEFML